MFYHNWGSPADYASRLPELLFRHDLAEPAELQCGQAGASWLACPSQCFNISGSFQRNERHHLMVTARNPPAASASSALLPTIWVTPLNHSDGNGTVQTLITGQSKVGAVCTGPVLHSPSNSNQHQLFDACNLSTSLGVHVGNQNDTELCIGALQGHVETLLAASPGNSTPQGILPLELQVPPLMAPWPPNSSTSSGCPDQSAPSARAGHGCISCSGGSVSTAPDGALHGCHCIGTHAPMQAHPGRVPTFGVQLWHPSYIQTCWMSQSLVTRHALWTRWHLSMETATDCSAKDTKATQLLCLNLVG